MPSANARVLGAAFAERRHAPGVFLDRFEVPQLLAGGGVHPKDAAAARRHAAGGGAVDQLVLDHQGRRGEQAAALARLDQRGLPQFLTRLGIECDGTAISGTDVHPAVPVGDAARVGRRGNLLGDGVEFGIVVPQFPARRTVQSEDAVIGTGVIHHAVNGDRGGLQPLDNGTGLVHPSHLQVADVVLVDLCQRAVASAFQRAVIGWPIIGVHPILRVTRLAEGNRAGQGNQPDAKPAVSTQVRPKLSLHRETLLDPRIASFAIR